VHGNRSRTLTNQSFEFCTTTVANTVGCPRWCTCALLDTRASEIVCKENKHGKHAQTQRMCRHGQGTCRQVLGMRARRAHAGRGMTRARKEKIRTQRGFVDVDCVAGCVCVNTHNEQSTARAGGLFVDHPGYCLVGQIGTRCASARCPSLSCLTNVVASHRNARSRSVEPLGTAFQWIGRIVDLCATALQVRWPPPCALVETHPSTLLSFPVAL